MSQQELVYDLTPVEIPVKIGGKNYILREADGAAAVQYRNAMLSCTQIGTDGKPSSVKGMAGTEPLLVSLCLLTNEPSETRRAVMIDEVKAWPYRIQKGLYDKAKEISELEEEDTEESLLKERAKIDKKLEAVRESKKLLSGSVDGSD